MIVESVAVVGLIVLLGLVWSGPAMWLVSGVRLRLPHALALAPALGLAVYHLVDFPLYRYLAPAPVWSLPLTVVMLAVSALLTLGPVA